MFNTILTILITINGGNYMGQRSQIIVLGKTTDGIYLESTYHNQWMYGSGFLNMLKDVLFTWDNGVKKLKAKDKWYPWQSSKLLDDTISFCNTKYFPECRGYFETTREIKEQPKSIEEILSSQDNNNGYILLLRDEDKLSYDIISGEEDTDEEERISAKEYLKLFYKNDEELSKEGFNPSDIEQLIIEINSYKRFDSSKIKLGKFEEVKQ